MSDVITGTGGDAVVHALHERGVRTVFGMCGHGSLGLLDALAESGIDFISVHHEQVAVHAADAYFRVTGRPGIVLTTVGAGAFNTTTALADACLDSSAVLVISGLVPSRYAGLSAYQEIDLHGTDEQVLVTRPLVKRALRVSDPLMLGPMISRAYYETLAGCPGPVHVHVPLDFFSVQGAFRVPPPIEPPRPALGQHDVERIIERIDRADRPVLYVGGGVLSAGAGAELLRFAEAADVPVVTSMLGQGALPEDHRLALGFTGAVGTRPANYAVTHADVLLVVGSRLDELDTSSWRPDAFIDPGVCSVLQVDIDPFQIGRHYPVAVGAVADARQSLGQLADAVLKRAGAHTEWHEELAPLVAAWRDEVTVLREDSSLPLQPAAVLDALRDALPDDGVLISGAGVRHLVGQHYPVKRPATMLVASGLSTMGWETAAAVGAKVGAGGRPVVGVIGDGAFNSTVSALSTAVAYSIDVLWVLLDNGGYQSIAAYQDRHFGRRLGTDFAYQPSGEPYQVDYVALAKAYGADGETISSLSEFAAAVRRGLERGGNYLVHVPTHNRPRPAASGHWDVNDIMSGTDVGIVPSPLRPDPVHAMTDGERQ